MKRALTHGAPCPRGRRRAAWVAPLLCTAALLAGCASGPPAPDWQLAAKAALDQALAAELRGDSRIAAVEFDRARDQIARTGRPGLLARAELLRCAAQAASLQLGPCAAFEALRADAAPAELAYAAHLAGSADAAHAALLPEAQRGIAALARAGAAATGSPAGSQAERSTSPAAADGTAAAALQAIADPLSRLVGAAVLLQAGQAGPQSIALAVDTASAQGWRQPLLAWLGVQLQRAQAAGDADAAARLQRRIRLAGGG